MQSSYSHYYYWGNRDDKNTFCENCSSKTNKSLFLQKSYFSPNRLTLHAGSQFSIANAFTK